jgi:hypothetical protein
MNKGFDKKKSDQNKLIKRETETRNKTMEFICFILS